MAETNQLTRALEIMAGYTLRIDEIFKEKGKMPYGMVKATLKEQREAFLKHTPEDIRNLINQHGFDAVNEYIKKMMEG